MPDTASLDELDSTPHAEVFDRQEPRTVRLELGADEQIPAHTHPESNVVIHLLSGHLELTLDGDPYDLEPGELIRFSGEREVSPSAVEPSTALIVLAPRRE